MFAAYKEKECRNKISINGADQNEKYYCPTCQKQLYVRVISGKKPHFCHYKGQSCIDYWNYDETDWSNYWKASFDINDVEKAIKNNDEIHHIDNLVKNRLAMMFQSTFMHADTFIGKTDYIISCGYKVMWLFNYVDLLKDGRLEESLNSKKLYWRNISKMFQNYPYDDNEVYIVAELKNDSGNPDVKAIAVIENLVSAYDSKELSVRRWLTREEFRQYFNDIADGKDPEEPFRIIEEEQRRQAAIEAEERRKQFELKQQQERERAEELRRIREQQELERKQREEEQKRIAREKYLVAMAEQKAKEEQEAKDRAERETQRRQAMELKAEQDRVIRQNEEEKQLLECKHTIVELWDEYKPKQFLTVSDRNGNVYRIDRDPSEQMLRYGKIYGTPKGNRLGARDEVISDALQEIWKKNHAM